MPSRRPKILLQTAAHVSGAAYYYKMTANNKQRMGVCIHPAYGGWFGIRGAFILRDLLVADLPLTLPPDVVPTKEQQAELLRLFNDHWRDMSYRNCIPVKCRYSPLQVQYFALKPKDRVQFIKSTLFPLFQQSAYSLKNTHPIQNNDSVNNNKLSQWRFFLLLNIEIPNKTTLLNREEFLSLLCFLITKT